MPNATARANARSTPKPTRHPDVELIALAQRCTDAAKRYNATGDALEKAEERYADVEAPAALIKTEDDARMRLFVGGAIGQGYSRSEIEVIGAICRTLNHVSAETYPAWRRCKTILESWSVWTERKELEAARSGLDVADLADNVARDELANVASQLAMTLALTEDGLFAKAHAFGLISSCVGNLGEQIKGRIDEESSLDHDVHALSLMRDLFALAEAPAPPSAATARQRSILAHLEEAGAA
jgi:hypothetical protein